VSKAWSGGSTRAWRNLRQQVFAQRGRRCLLRLDGVCTVAATTVHHVVPKARGGADELSNLVPACAPCNLAVGDGPAPPSGRRPLVF